MRLTLRCVAPMLLVSVAACGDDTAADASSTVTDPSSSSSSESSSTTPPEESSTAQPEESSSSEGGSTVADTSSDTGTTEPPACMGGGSTCGDGIVCGNEECDCGGVECTPQSFGEITCIDVSDPSLPGPITGGVLGCNPASCRFDTSLCTYCGDGEVNGNEQCESGEPVNATCAQLGAGVAGDVECNGSCEIDTTQCTECAFEFEFESDTCPDNFSTASLMGGAGASSWACGDPSVYGLGPGAAAPTSFGTNLTGPYNANEISALISPEIDMSVCSDDGIIMTMRHWHNFEGGDLNSDGGIVQVSEDGVVWTTVAPTDGDLYDDMAVLDATYPPVDGVNGFSGGQDENSWGNSEFDLSDYAGSNSLQIRFVFGSNGSVQQGGWYIDSMSVLGSGAGI